jgi:hypothetical protein
MPGNSRGGKRLKLRDTDGSSSIVPNVKKSLETAAYKEDCINSNCRKHGDRDCSPIFGVFYRAHHAMVVGFEEGPDHRENHDCEAGDDDA